MFVVLVVARCALAVPSEAVVEVPYITAWGSRPGRFSFKVVQNTADSGGCNGVPLKLDEQGAKVELTPRGRWNNTQYLKDCGYVFKLSATFPKDLGLNHTGVQSPGCNSWDNRPEQLPFTNRIPLGHVFQNGQMNGLFQLNTTSRPSADLTDDEKKTCETVKKSFEPPNNGVTFEMYVSTKGQPTCDLFFGWSVYDYNGGTQLYKLVTCSSASSTTTVTNPATSSPSTRYHKHVDTPKRHSRDTLLVIAIGLGVLAVITSLVAVTKRARTTIV
ncbi:MAG: hypothetical protein ACPGR8_01095 [Limisphaerales bacterium]